MPGSVHPSAGTQLAAWHRASPTVPSMSKCVCRSMQTFPIGPGQTEPPVLSPGQRDHPTPRDGRTSPIPFHSVPGAAQPGAARPGEVLRCAPHTRRHRALSPPLFDDACDLTPRVRFTVPTAAGGQRPAVIAESPACLPGAESGGRQRWGRQPAPRATGGDGRAAGAGPARPTRQQPPARLPRSGAPPAGQAGRQRRCTGCRDYSSQRPLRRRPN